MSCWWAITSEDLMAMLQAVAKGEDPEMVYMEAYANGWVSAADWSDE